MSEVVRDHEGRGSTEWESLSDVPFNAEGDQDKKEQSSDILEDSESLNLQYETELLAPENVKSDISSYVIRDGQVYDKATREEISDTDTILRVKTSRFLYNEALSDQNTLRATMGERFVDRGIDYHIDKIMQKYAIRDEENTYGPNKLVRGLVEKGEFSTDEGSPTVEGTKFDMFTGVKADYGKALIERKLRQRGKTMTNFELVADDSHFVKDGYSTFTIKMNTESLQQDDGKLHHPAAEQLRELDAKLMEAKQNGDQKAAHRALMELRQVVREQPLVVTREQFQNMSDDEKKRYFMLKHREAQVLGVKKMEDYWEQQVLSLKSKK